MVEDEYIRPSPEELLKRIYAGQEMEEKKGRGRLTIFFGYAPGVGKTYAMLYNATARKKEDKLDVVIGYVEPHKRPETRALMEDFELLPSVEVEYHGLKLLEPDIEAIIRRRPNIVLIDELAHSNAPGLKHFKRYEDVEEVLNAGIDVYTTLNVQHIESLKDVVCNITGTVVMENIPDPVFLRADGVKLIDLPIDQLLKRLSDGKVYTRDMASEAVQRFFKPSNLLALRQIAMRQMILHLDKQMTMYAGSPGMEAQRRVSEKVLACINANPYAEDILRAAYRLSTEHEAELIGLHIETDEDKSLSEEKKKWLKNAFDFAKELDIKTISIKSNDVSTKITSFAIQNGITKIVMGKPHDNRKLRSVDDILSKTEGVDVYIFTERGKTTK